MEVVVEVEDSERRVVEAGQREGKAMKVADYVGTIYYL
jgi:hypothetical protein